MIKEKVVLALSGGVDSAVSAYLLKEQGYEVVAIFMQNWDDYLNGYCASFCTQGQDWQDAQCVAKQLGIEIHKIDFLSEYWDKVFTVFLKQLTAGTTPNPDILCNNIIKFHHFVKYVIKEFNPSFIATGHYAKIIRKNGDHFLGKARDIYKDQTYFLCQIDRSILNKLIFPLGNLTKQEVRKIAQNINLVNAEKKDSVGICFIGEHKFSNFLANYLPDKEGRIMDFYSEKILGIHRGTYHFTIGQRRGLNLSSNRPYYVIGKQIKNNTIYVVKGWDDKWLYSDSCTVININWLIEEQKLRIMIKQNIILTAKFRYRQTEVIVRINDINSDLKNLEVLFHTKQRAITPGQYAVFYYDIFCLGGGVILKTNKINEFSEPIEII